MRFPFRLAPLFLIAVAGLHAQNAPAPATPPAPYQDPTLPVETRVEDLLKRLTLEEKITLLHADSTFGIAGVPRLGIPEHWTSDGPHGVREEIAREGWNPAGRTDDASTAFPCGIALAATWNPAIAMAEGQAIGEEARARGKDIMLGPAVNIERTPLNGRSFEYYGEDPWLSGRIAVGFIHGEQSRDVASCVKHYAANNQETQRNSVDVEMDEHTLREIYLPAFEAAVKEGGVLSIMAAYNKFRGVYCAENDYLLNQVLKKDWGFQGVVMTDWGAAHDTPGNVLGGLDLEMGTRVGNNIDYDSYYLGAGFRTGVQDGTYPVALLDDKVRRNLRVMIATKVLDAQGRQPGSFDTLEHQTVARQVAEEAMVLLKNSGATLPLDAGHIKTIAIIGDNATHLQASGGQSSGIKAQYEISPADGLRKYLGDRVKITFAQGYATPQPQRGGRGGPSARGPGAAPVAPVNPLTIENLKTQLTLTDAQATAIAPILDEINQGQTALNIALAANASLRASSIDKITAILDGDQKAEFAQLANPNPFGGRGARGARGTGPGAPAGPSPAELADAAVAAAKAADVAIVFAGLNKNFDTEGSDRPNMALPAGQDDLIRRVVAANPRTIVVMVAGSPVEMGAWIDQVPAVLLTWYGGSEAGNAIARTLFGEVNPSGKLPCTFPKQLADSPAHALGAYPGQNGVEEYKEGLLVGYRWFDTKNIEPLFSFGHGLSYTTFAYSNLRMTATGAGGATVVNASFEVTNTGTRAGAEVAELYVHQDKPALMRPEKELKGFQKISLRPGESRTVTIPLRARAFAYWDPEKKGWLAEGGAFQIMVGGGSRDLPLQQDYLWPETVLLPP